MGDIINAVADVFGFGPASKQAKGIEQAGEAGAAAQRYAADIQRQMFERQVALQEPWRQAGVGALNQLIPLAGQYTPFNANQMYQEPGYQFRLSEGLKAMERGAAARGGLQSGAALKAAQRYGQEYAAGEYQNAFNRYLREREARLNPLQSLANVGQTSAQTMAGQAGTYGSNIGNLNLLAGANQANAALAMGNIRASQYGGYGSALGSVLNYLRPSQQSPAPVVNRDIYGPGSFYPYGTSEGE